MGSIIFIIKKCKLYRSGSDNNIIVVYILQWQYQRLVHLNPFEGAHYTDLGCIHNNEYPYKDKLNFQTRTMAMRRIHIVQSSNLGAYRSTRFLCTVQVQWKD